MGCFLACFGNTKNRKRRKSPNKRHVSYEPLKSTTNVTKQEIVEIPISPVPESRDKIEEQLSLNTRNTRKKVTFDLNVKAYEEVTTQEIAQSDDKEEKKEDKIVKQIQSTSLSEDSSNSLSSGSFPSNHRYGNCRNSDDEYEEIESDESDFDDDDCDDGDDYEDVDDDDDDDDVVDYRLGEPESSESFFSLPVGSRTSASSVAEKEVNSPLKNNGSLDEEKKTIGSNRNVRDRSQYVHSVLNPVENLTQWKAVKAKTPSPFNQHQRKENIKFESEPKITLSAEPTFKLSPFSFTPNSDPSSPPPKKEIAVDASLSTWLGSSESTPSIKSSNISIGTGSAEVNKSPRSYSPRSHEDRPILGALTLQELKQFSPTPSPRKSPTHSPDEMPILGTVGSYWSHTNQATDSSSGSSSCKGIPNTTSKYREDKRVNWHSTPFETRLERALNKGAAEGYLRLQRV